MHDMSIRTVNAMSSTDPHHVVSAISHLREAASDLDTALAFTNILCLFAAEPGRLRDLYRDLDALVAQMDAMRLQFAEFVEAAEGVDGAESP